MGQRTKVPDRAETQTVFVFVCPWKSGYLSPKIPSHDGETSERSVALNIVNKGPGSASVHMARGCGFQMRQAKTRARIRVESQD